MALDPDLRELLGDDESPPLSTLSLEEARAITRGVVALQGEPVPVAEIRDVAADGEDGPVPIRLYRPHGTPAPSPVLWVSLVAAGSLIASAGAFRMRKVRSIARHAR